MSRGLFITLEGGEGAGKSTNLVFIRQWLHREGREVVVTREPGGTELGERARDILLHSKQPHITPESEMLLMFVYFGLVYVLIQEFGPQAQAGFSIGLMGPLDHVILFLGKESMLR